jgi:hypothetical protein
MEALWFFCAVVAFFVLIWAMDVYRHRHPLTTQELLTLSRKRQRNRALWKFDFSTMPQPADAVEKKAMKSQGEFVGCDLGYPDAPARIAGLLKYKKHEWIVIAFINSFHVRHLWWNKGPDGMRVWSFLRDHSLKVAIRSLRPDAIAILHNHPNPDPSRYGANVPSDPLICGQQASTTVSFRSTALASLSSSVSGECPISTVQALPIQSFRLNQSLMRFRRSMGLAFSRTIR